MRTGPNTYIHTHIPAYITIGNRLEQVAGNGEVLCNGKPMTRHFVSQETRSSKNIGECVYIWAVPVRMFAYVCSKLMIIHWSTRPHEVSKNVGMCMYVCMYV